MLYARSSHRHRAFLNAYKKGLLCQEVLPTHINSCYVSNKLKSLGGQRRTTAEELQW